MTDRYTDSIAGFILVTAEHDHDHIGSCAGQTSGAYADQRSCWVGSDDVR